MLKLKYLKSQQTHPQNQPPNLKKPSKIWKYSFLSKFSKLNQILKML